MYFDFINQDDFVDQNSSNNSFSDILLFLALDKSVEFATQFANSRILSNLGFDNLSEYFRESAFKSLNDFTVIFGHMLDLDLSSNISSNDLGSDEENSTQSFNIEELLHNTLESANFSHELIVSAISIAKEFDDFILVDLLQKPLLFEVSRIDWLDTQLHLINMLGTDGYLVKNG